VEVLSSDAEEDWDFRIPYWENHTITIVSSEYNLAPMTGEYTFVYDFCNSLNIYMGNYEQNKNTFGWAFGTLTEFIGYDVIPVIPSPTPSAPTQAPSSQGPRDDFHEYTAYLEFSQSFLQGDAGAPCTDDIPRSGTINIYCGLAKANCTQVPGNKGAACINANGTTNPGFCICSIQYNATIGICSGLTINLLSNKCPPGKAVPIPVPAALVPDSSRSVGIAFAIMAAIIVVALFAGYIYNFTVHAKRGCQAVPFYDTCTGKRDAPSYTPSSPAPPAEREPPLTSGSYGAI